MLSEVRFLVRSMAEVSVGSLVGIRFFQGKKSTLLEVDEEGLVW